MGKSSEGIINKEPSSNSKDSEEVHRVLVLQGGGALGAYEAGVYDVLYYWIKKDQKDQDIADSSLKKHNIFDIVAGTAACLIHASSRTERKPWMCRCQSHADPTPQEKEPKIGIGVID